MPATMSVTRSAAAAMRWFTSAEQVAEPEADLRRRMHALADLVGDDDERDARARPGRRRARRRLTGWPRRRRPRSRRLATQTVRQSTTIRSSCGTRRRQAPRRRAAPRRSSHSPGRSARCRAMRVAHVAVGGPGGGDESGAARIAERPRATAYRLLPLRAPPRMRCDWCSDDPQVLPRRPVMACRRPGRSPGSRIVLLPTPSRPTAASGCTVGFVPDYSDGVAADSHRLPWGPRSRRAARTPRAAATLAR